MKKMIVLMAIFGIVLFAFPVMALERSYIAESPYPEGLYFGLGGVYDAIIGHNIDDTWESGAGPTAKIGYSFGSFAIEGEWLQTYHNGKGSYIDASITGYSLNFREALSRPVYPNEIYVLAGLGYYTLELDQGSSGLTGLGFNLGAGYEHFITKHVSLNISLIYRFIQYDKAEANNVTTDLYPTATGDMASVNVGLNVYF